MPVSIRQQVLQSDQMPAPPVPAVELAALTSLPDARISQIAALIKRDPVLADTVLKLCNSAAFGLECEVSSIERATEMVGIQQIRILVLGLMIMSASEMDEPAQFDSIRYRKRALVASGSGRAMAARRLPMLAGEAFVAGLVLDVGIPLLQRIAPKAYTGVTQLCAGGGHRLHDAEESMLGITHMEAGAALLRAWGLPKAIYETVSVHHCPQRYDGDEETTQLVDIVASASEIANLFCEPNKAESMKRVRGICSGYFQLRDAEIDELLTTVGNDAREAARLFDIDQAASLDYHRVCEEASLSAVTSTLSP